MSLLPDMMAELTQSIEALYDDELTPEQAQRLEALLADNPAARRQYIQLTAFFVSLQSCCATLPGEDNDECGMMNGELPETASGERSVQHPSTGPRFPNLDLSVADSPFLIQPMGPLPSPLSPLPSSFFGGAVFSYLMAAVIVGVGLLAAWVCKLPDREQFVHQTPVPSVDRPIGSVPHMTFVGRITGMVDCRWADPNTAVPGPVAVPLGRKYALASGLMEITYDSGAKVILQGPVTYEVESAAGGFLSVGKLTARVEKRGERREERGEGREERGEDAVRSTEYGVRSTEESSTIARHQSEIGNQKSGISPLSTLHSPLFAVRTPTAVVTDIGTEFGVEVSPNGSSEVHVLRGEVDLMTQHDQRHVRLRASAADDNTPSAARVEAGALSDGKPQIVLVTPSPDRFLRTLPGASVGARGERIVVASRFTLSDEGWTASSPSSAGMVYVREGGNPGGYIQTQEGIGPDFFYWIAPAKFSGNGSSLFGGQLKFDVYTTIFQSTPGVEETIAMEPPMVILEGRDGKIAADQQTPAKRDQWTSMSVPLNAAGKWYRPEGPGVLEGKPTDRTPVSEEVIRAVLADLRSVWIRAEYMHGRDLGRLDNVLFVTPANVKESTESGQGEKTKANR